jgi:hypothetical protein
LGASTYPENDAIKKIPAASSRDVNQHHQLNNRQRLTLNTCQKVSRNVNLLIKKFKYGEQVVNQGYVNLQPKLMMQ